MILYDSTLFFPVVHSTTHGVMSEHHSKFDLHSMVFKIAEGVGEEPPSTFIGRVRKDGGKSGDGRNCHENFGPPKIMVPDQNFWKKLVRADQYYQEILVRVSKNWSGPSIYI